MADAEESRSFMLHYYLVLYGILYYDYLSTLYKEYWTIWRAKWSMVKILFFVNRYLMLVNSIIILVGFRLRWSTERCQRQYIPWQTLLPVVIAGAGSMILLLRTYIIWGQVRWVLYILIPMLIAHLSTSAFLAATHVGALRFPSGTGPCMVAAKNAVMDLYCVLPMMFDLTASGLCVYRSFKLQKEAGPFASSLLRNFTKHGTLHAVGAAAANVSNLAFMAITSKQLGLPTVPSNGGMLCTVFSSIFISRLAMSLKDEEEARRKATEGMIPLASIRTSGTSSDFKSGRDTSLSGATYVNMSTLLANKRISGVSTASTAAVEKDSCIAAATEAAQPNVSSAAENPENPDDYPQWLNRDERPTHMVWMQAAPRKSGGRYITPIPLSHAEAYEASKRAKELVEAGQARAPIPRDTQETDGSFVTIPLTMPSIDSDRADKGSYWSPEYSAEMSKCHSGNWDKEGRFMETAKDISPDMWKGGKLVKRAKSDHPVGRKDGHKQYDRKMTVIPEVSPVPSPSDASFMDRASKITPFVYGSFSVRPAYSTEASPTETTWLGGDLHESPTNLEEAARLAKAQQAPLDVPAHMHDAHPSNTKDTASPTTAVTASDASSEETGSEDASHRIHRVPVPSPVSPKKCSSSRLSSRRVSWTSEITASLQKVQV